jgi:hypothetical protein
MDHGLKFKLTGEPIDIQLTVHINNILNSNWTHWSHINRDVRLGILRSYVQDPHKSPLKGSVGARIHQLMDYYGEHYVQRYFETVYGWTFEESAA